MGDSGRRRPSKVWARWRAEAVVAAALAPALIVGLLPGNSLRAAAGEGSPAMLTLTRVPQTMPADGVSRSDITALVVDANNNPVSADPVTFSTDGDVTFESAHVTTNSNGVAFTHLIASTTPGPETITA